jgi:hypothetical protein
MGVGRRRGMGPRDGTAVVTLASLIVSALALLVAAITALTHGRRLAQIEVDRRRDERQPRLDLDYDKNPLPLLRFTNHGPGDLADVSIATVHKPPVIASYRFSNGTDALEGSLGPVSLGEAMTISINRNDEADGGGVALRATCRAGDDEWIIALRCEVPGSATASVW